MDDERAASCMLVPDAARRLWRTLAGDPKALTPSSLTVVRGSRGICRPGWTGVVRLGDSYVIEAGEADDTVVEALSALDDPSDPDQVMAAFNPQSTLGPGELAYLPQDRRDKAGRHDEISEVSAAEVTEWLAVLPKEDVDESSVGEMPRVMVLRRNSHILGAAGHLVWPEAIGHVGVLVAPAARGAGLGVRLGAAATRRAVEAGLEPQWRAATWNAASRAAAQRIGYVEMGRQFSFLP